MVREHFILAHSSSIDMDANTISVFQFLEDLTIHTSSQQAQLPVQAILIAKREQERGKIETQFTLKVSDPQEKEIIVQNFNLKMEDGHRRSRLRVNFSIPILATGEHVVRVECAEHPGLNSEFRFLIQVIREVPRDRLPTQ